MPIVANAWWAERRCSRASAGRYSAGATITVEQPGTRQFPADLGSAEPVDCRAVVRLGGSVIAQQGAASGFDAQRPVGAGRLRRGREALEGVGRLAEHAASSRGLDELREDEPRLDARSGRA
jgi:hypothetical protein